MASIGITEEVTVSTQSAAHQQGRNPRNEPPAPTLNRAEMIALTAANLSSLLAWLYTKPQT